MLIGVDAVSMATLTLSLCAAKYANVHDIRKFSRCGSRRKSAKLAISVE